MIEPTLTQVLTGNVSLLLIHLDCETNERSIPFGYLLHLLVQGSSGLSGVFIAEEVVKQETGGQEIPQRLIYRHSWRPFRTCPGDPPVPLIKLLLVNSKNSSLGATVLKCPIIRISGCWIKGIVKNVCGNVRTHHRPSYKWTSYE